MVFSTFQAESGVGASALVEDLEEGEKNDEIVPVSLMKIVRAALKEYSVEIMCHCNFNL